MNHEPTLHEVDGIQEQDNALPRWWLGTFFITVFFGWGYWEYYHILRAGALPGEQFAQEMSARKARQGESTVDEQTLIAAASGSQATVGAQLFRANCVSCHGEQGEGKIGPNLTDKAWIHGGSAVEIHRSIATGYPLKGMPAWQPVLGNDKTIALAAYVVSIRNTAVPGRPPEGNEQSARAVGDDTRTAQATP